MSETSSEDEGAVRGALRKRGAVATVRPETAHPPLDMDVLAVLQAVHGCGRCARAGSSTPCNKVPTVLIWYFTMVDTLQLSLYDSRVLVVEVTRGAHGGVYQDSSAHCAFDQNITETLHEL